MTRYTQRQLDEATRTALEVMATHDSRPDARKIALAALARMDRRPEPAQREILQRFTVCPGLEAAVEDSHNVLLVISTPGTGQELARSGPVGDEALVSAVTLARVWAAAAEDDAEQARLAGLRDALEWRRWSEPRPGEDADSRAAAAAEMAAAGLSVHSAQLVLKRAYGHLSGSFNVDGTDQLGTASYNREDGTYHVRVPG